MASKISSPDIQMRQFRAACSGSYKPSNGENSEGEAFIIDWDEMLLLFFSSIYLQYIKIIQDKLLSRSHKIILSHQITLFYILSQFLMVHQELFEISLMFSNKSKERIIDKRGYYNYWMLFGDPQNDDREVSDDWSIILRNLKGREECHRDLIQYNLKLVGQVRDQANLAYLNQQIQQHRFYFSGITTKNNIFSALEQDISLKYQGVISKNSEIGKLMTRVAARIIEICNPQIENGTQTDVLLSQNYVKMKRSIGEKLKKQQGLELGQIMEIVLQYSRSKLQGQIQKLEKLIQTLQNGDYSGLKTVYYARQSKKSKTGCSIQRRLDVLRDLSKSRPNQNIKTQQKNQEKQRKIKQKHMQTLYNTMQLSKQQFLETQCSSLQQKAEKLYHQIMDRNKFNNSQIIQFSAQGDDFQTKTRYFQQQLQRQKRQKKVEVIVCKPFRKEASKVNSTLSQPVKDQAHENKKIEEQINEIEQIVTQENITGIKDDRRLMTSQFKLKSLSAKKDVGNLPQLFGSFLQTRTRFPQFMDRHQRQNAFPTIAPSSALDHKTQLTKIKIDKILRTTLKTDKNEFLCKKAVPSHRLKPQDISTKEVEEIRPAGGIWGREIMQNYSLHVRKAQIRNFDQTINIFH